MTLLMIILLLVLVGAIPAWPYSRSWGYTPSASCWLCGLLVPRLRRL